MSSKTVRVVVRVPIGGTYNRTEYAAPGEEMEMTEEDAQNYINSHLVSLVEEEEPEKEEEEEQPEAEEPAEKPAPKPRAPRTKKVETEK